MKILQPSILKIACLFLFVLIGCFLIEILYFSRIYSETTNDTFGQCDLIVMYTGTCDINKAAQWALAKNVPLLVSGGEEAQVLSEAQSILGN